MRKVVCVHCGRVPKPRDGWTASCQPCRKRRARAAAALRESDPGCKAPMDCPERESRIQRYEAMVEAGLRLFEPTPDADGGGR